jgi:hypothetical protein
MNFWLWFAGIVIGLAAALMLFAWLFPYPTKGNGK